MAGPAQTFRQLICPSGCLVKGLSSPICKNISTSRLTQISSLTRTVPSHTEGRFAIVTSAGRDAVDAAASGDARGWQGGSIWPVS
jgi:hypothetical protein